MEYYGRGLGANIVGHSANRPLVGSLAQSFPPPPQLRIPDDPIKEAPIIKMTVPKNKLCKCDSVNSKSGGQVPVTIGGNIRCNMRGGTKDMKISRKEHIRDVPDYPMVSTNRKKT